MITNLKFKNCFAFNKQVELSLAADMRAKRFSSNVINVNKNINILKSVAIYGPNNTGKTTVINCVTEIKNTLLNKKTFIQSNIFEDNNICELGIEFISNKDKFAYEYKYNSKTEEYVYEEYKKITIDEFGNEKEQRIILKDTINKKYNCPEDKDLERILNLTAKNNILIYLIETDNFKVLNDMKNKLIEIANKIEVIDMNKIQNKKTIELLKNKNNITNKTVEFIKNADLYLDDYYYNNNVEIEINDKLAEEKLLKNQDFIDEIKLVSVYKGVPVPSLIFDSIGTRKFAALASYIIESLEEGKVLFVDELDSSLHFKMTRSIISLFNNAINTKAQLIATMHDISLLDCNKLFRKEQVWFTDKQINETLLYSLKDFSYAKTGIRDTTDLKEKYSKGVLGAVPDPDLISALLEVEDDEDK